jgi:hypothetical protein
MGEQQANNPLHGVSLEQMVNSLVEHYGWNELGNRIKIRCFTSDPSVKSSLKFLRKTSWNKVFGKAQNDGVCSFIKGADLPMVISRGESGISPYQKAFSYGKRAQAESLDFCLFKPVSFDFQVGCPAVL